MCGNFILAPTWIRRRTHNRTRMTPIHNSSTMTRVLQLHPFLQHLLDVPTSAATLLVPTYPIAWPLNPPSQPLCVLVNTLSHWTRNHHPQHTNRTYTNLARRRRLCALPTSVLTPLFHALATALQPPSVGSVYPEQTALCHRFASLRRPSLKQRVARHVATAVRSLKTSCARATQRLLEAGPVHDTTVCTDCTLPPVIPLVDVVDRVCMQMLTSRTRPVVLHWTRQAMTAAGTAET